MHNFRKFLYFVCALIASNNIYAGAIAYSNGVSVTPISVRGATLSSSGHVIQSIEFQATKASNQSSYFTRAVQFNKPTTAQSIKAFGKRNALGLGLTAVTLAIGWSLDEITKDIYPVANNGSSPAITCNPFYTVGGNAFGAGQGCTPQSAIVGWRNNCIAWGSSNHRSNPVCNITPTFSSNGSSVSISPYTVTYLDYGYPSTMTGMEASSITNASYNQPAIPASTLPATDAQIADTLLPAISPSNLPKLHTDPLSGAVVNTQEVVDKATEVANEYDRAINPEHVPQTAPNTAPVTDLNTSVESNPQPNPTSQPLSFPPFCDWASPVCDFIDWIKTPFTDTETFTLGSIVETKEIVESDYSSGLGQGTCPAPMVVTLMGNAVPFKFDSLCEIAGILKLLLVAGAYFASIYILLGIKR